MELHRDRIFGRYTFLEFKVCDFEFRTDWNADETDPLRRSADSYGFFHRDTRRFFEVDGVEQSCTESEVSDVVLISSLKFEILGGKIQIDSSLNQGSSFYFTLPKNTIKNTKYKQFKITIL